MGTASDLLQQHFDTLVADNARWQTSLADEIVWELPYAPALGHPERLSGREAVVRHVTWFLGVVEKFRFFDVRVHAFADPTAAVAEARAEGLIKPTGRVYRQEYVVFLRARAGKITFLREYFDPVRAAKALDAPIVDLQSKEDTTFHRRKQDSGPSPESTRPCSRFASTRLRGGPPRNSSGIIRSPDCRRGFSS